ncbi:MAG: ornithine carbamoyltransferase [Nitrososphaerota archaeon]|nr:ornithine carbamoyltransferase [Nitrososphaerota archaeon]
MGLKKNLLSLGELTSFEFKAILDLADTFKVERVQQRFKHRVPRTSLALVLERPSTRTRVSFEVAMFELGGHAVVLNAGEIQSSRGETAEDTTRVLSRFCHAVAARVASHQTLEAYTKASRVPVINALSDKYHPCQSIADMLTIRQHKRRLKGIKIAWIGDGNNVCNSLLIAASLSGSHISIACPKNYAPLPEAISVAKREAEKSGSIIQVMESPSEAAADADVITTDTFVSMGDEEERSERMKKFFPKYQVNENLMRKAKRDAIFLHCLPAHRGEEVTESVIDGPQSWVWQEAENRLHAQKAVLYMMMNQFASDRV